MNKLETLSIAGAVLLVTAILLAATPISVAQQVTGPRKGGTFITAVRGDPITLNSGTTTSLFSHTSGDAAFNSLLETQHDLSVRPGIAERWDVASDGLAYTFFLVKNATWHDGKKFTSADVKFTFEQILLPLHPLGKANFGVIQSIETIDEFTVRFKLSQPWPSLLLFLSNSFHSPLLPKHIYEGTDIRQNPANFKPVGTGAFKFVEYVKGDRVVYERNPNYWRAGRPYIDKLIVKIVPTEETAVLALQKGEIDHIGFWITPQSLKKLDGLPDIEITTKLGTTGQPGLTWLYFNLDHSILKDSKVRQAIAHAIDRKKISDVARLGRSPAAVGPVHVNSAWAFDPNLQPSYPYDLSKANKLLDEAGYPRKEGGVRFKLILNDLTGSVYNADAEMIKDMLVDVGIEVDHQLLALATGNDLMFNRLQFELGIRQYFAGPDPSITLAATFLASQVKAGTYTNAMNYQNPKADEILLQAQGEADPAKRRGLMLEWQKIIMTDLPGYPIIYDKFGQAYRKDWVGVPPNPWGSQSMFAENIWWTKGTLIEAPKPPTPPPQPTTEIRTTTVTQTVTTTAVRDRIVQVEVTSIWAYAAVGIGVIIAAVGVYAGRRRRAA